jgi:hypothetical protein
MEVNSRKHARWSPQWDVGVIRSLLSLYRRRMKLFMVDVTFFFINLFRPAHATL